VSKSFIFDIIKQGYKKYIYTKNSNANRCQNYVQTIKKNYNSSSSNIAKQANPVSKLDLFEKNQH
jgi:hypothetical protein